MTNIDCVDIKSVGENLMLECSGDFALQETILKENKDNNNEGLKFSMHSAPDKPIQGIFSLKYLVLFTKCTNLCNLIFTCILRMIITLDYKIYCCKFR